jgi:molecular chaperone DnaJ
MRGLGIPDPYGRKGDQLVMVDLTVPKKISSEHRALLEKLVVIEGEECKPEPGGKGFFDRIKEIFD